MRVRLADEDDWVAREEKFYGEPSDLGGHMGRLSRKVAREQEVTFPQVAILLLPLHLRGPRLAQRNA